MEEALLREVLSSFTPFVPEEDLRHRLDRFKRLMVEEGFSGAILFHPPDLYYLAGSRQEGILFVDPAKEPIYCVQKYPARARTESPWEVIPIRSMRELPHHLSLEGKVGTEMDLIPHNMFQRLSKIFDHKEWGDISPLIRACKAVKTDWEVATLRKAGNLVVQGYLKALDILEEGITEVELASRVGTEMRILGHEGGETMRGGRMDGFLGHILSGYAATIPSYMNAPLNGIGLSPSVPVGPSMKRIARGEAVVFDFFATSMGYLVDMTRTCCLGPAPQKMRDAYSVLIDIHTYLREHLKPGKGTLEIYNSVLKIADKSPFKDHFMGYGDYRVNFIGHGVGTEIDEYPFIARGLEMELKEHMVVAVEPKFLFPQEGAVGLENTYLITPEGAESLTPAPEEFWEK